MFPLFDRFPELATRLPRVPLCELPTPVTKARGLSAHLPPFRELWIKRDDLSAPRLGGNKARKLEFVLGEIAARGATRVVALGGLNSNWCTALSFYGAGRGLLVTNHQWAIPNVAPDHEKLAVCARYARHLRVHRDQDAWMRAWARELALGPARTFVPPPGGSTARSDLGYVNAALELEAQVEAGVLPAPDAVVVPYGSGGTWAGLVKGFSLTALRPTIFGVRVVGLALAGAWQAQARLCLPPLLETKTRRRVPWHIVHGYLGRGYAHQTLAAQRAIALAADDGLALETTYTGKALAALLDLARCRHERRWLLWNTYNSRALGALLAPDVADSRLGP